MGYDQLFAIGLLINTVAGIYMLAQMFRVKWWWGVIGILLPFSIFVFLFKHWSMAKNPFFINLPGLVLIVLSLALAPDKPTTYVNLNEDLPLVIKEADGWTAMINERDKPSHLYMTNILSGAFVHFHTYPASYFEERGLSDSVKDISKSTFKNACSLFTNISIETELERNVGQWKCYEIVFRGSLEGENMKGSLMAININKYLITTMFQSLEDRYINNKSKFEKLLESIKTDTPNQG